METFSFLLIICLGFRVINEMKVSEDYGFLAQLLESCFVDVMTFTIYFLLWVTIFAYLYKVLHQDPSTPDFDIGKMFTSQNFRLFLFTYFNSIGAG